MPFLTTLTFTALHDEPSAEVMASPHTLALRYSDVRRRFKAGLATVFAGSDSAVRIDRNDAPLRFAALDRLTVSHFAVRLLVVTEVRAMVSGHKGARVRVRDDAQLGDPGTRSRSRLRSEGARARSASARLASREGKRKMRARKSLTGAEGERKRVQALDRIVREKEVESGAAEGFAGAASYFIITEWDNDCEDARAPREPAPEGYVDSSEEDMAEYSPSMGEFIVDDADDEKLADGGCSAEVPPRRMRRSRRVSTASNGK